MWPRNKHINSALTLKLLCYSYLTYVLSCRATSSSHSLLSIQTTSQCSKIQTCPSLPHQIIRISLANSSTDPGIGEASPTPPPLPLTLLGQSLSKYSAAKQHVSLLPPAFLSLTRALFRIGGVGASFAPIFRKTWESLLN